MAKKKKDKDTDNKEAKTFEIKAEANIMFKPQEWAMNEGLNPILFEAWKNEEPITREKFEELKKQVM